MFSRCLLRTYWCQALWEVLGLWQSIPNLREAGAWGCTWNRCPLCTSQAKPHAFSDRGTENISKALSLLPAMCSIYSPFVQNRYKCPFLRSPL